MCPTADQKGVRIGLEMTGLKLHGPWQHLRLNARGVEIANYMRPEGEEALAEGAEIKRIWDIVDMLTFRAVFGEEILMQIDVRDDDYFL